MDDGRTSMRSASSDYRSTLWCPSAHGILNPGSAAAKGCVQNKSARSDAGSSVESQGLGSGIEPRGAGPAGAALVGAAACCPGTI
jgi:hypothetical protein